jgi:hypothetical protein
MDICRELIKNKRNNSGACGKVDGQRAHWKVESLFFKLV